MSTDGLAAATESAKAAFPNPARAFSSSSPGAVGLLLIAPSGALARVLCSLVEPLGHPYQVEQQVTPGGTVRADGFTLCATQGMSDGIEFVRALSAKGTSSRLCVMTEDPTEETGAAILHAGADLWLPLRLSPVLARAFLLAAIRRAGARQLSHVSLDPDRHTIQVSDWSAKLTYSQYKIVEYLMTHSQRWVPEHELRERALNKHRSSDSLVRVHIRSIRRALGPHGACLRSTPRVGYRLRFLDPP